MTMTTETLPHTQDMIELRVCRPGMYPPGAKATEMQGHYIRGVDYPDALVKAARMFPGESLLVEPFKRRNPATGLMEMQRRVAGVADDVRLWTWQQMTNVQNRK